MSARENKGRSIVFEDRSLVRRFNAGDAQALRRIYEKYRPDLFRVAGALLHDSVAAEDVVHDVFVGFASQAGRFELKGSLKGYLVICVANRARNVIRQDRQLGLERLAEHRPASPRQPDSSELVSDAELHQRVRVALATVRERVAQIDTMVLRGEKVVSCVAEPNLVFRFDVVQYFSRQYGTMEEGRMNGALAYRFVTNRPEKQFMVLFPLWKKCLRRPFTEEQLEIMEKLSPTGIMDLLLETEYRELGPAQINGTAAEGFEFDVKPLRNIVPKYLIDVQEGTGTFWVGTDEPLLVRIEGDLLLGRSAMTLYTDLHLHEVENLESCDVELDESLFSTDIPEGYTELKLTDFIPVKLSLAGLGMLPVGCIAWGRIRRNKAARRPTG